MKKIFVNEEWCLGCHLCEYYCAFANAEETDMVHALKDQLVQPCIRIEEGDQISYAVNCRHCAEPLCVRGCLTGSLSVKDGVVTIDRAKCIGCYTCIALCPYGAILPSQKGAVQKCAICLEKGEYPLCVANCPNKAIVFEEEALR